MKLIIIFECSTKNGEYFLCNFTSHDIHGWFERQFIARLSCRSEWMLGSYNLK